MGGILIMRGNIAQQRVYFYTFNTETAHIKQEKQELFVIVREILVFLVLIV